MGIGDRISSALGRGMGAIGSVALDSFSKAGEAMDQNLRAEKAATKAGMPEPASDAARSLMYDPFAVIDQLGYKDRPSGITYHTLSEISRRVPVIAAIHQTRITQVASFSTPQENDREPGFQIVLRDREESPTKQDKIKAREIEKWVQNTGSTQRFGKDNFEDFLKKTTRDSLTYDQDCFEIVDNRKGQPSDFYAVDGATMRIADVPLGAELDDDPDRVRYVQVYDETVISEFAAHEICFGVRNPRTGIRLNGYGLSEIEQMLTTVTAMLWAFEYNKRFFSQGSVTKGILNFKGTIPDDKMRAFRRSWYQMISGVANAWRTPVTNADELQYINLHSSNRDMEFAEWTNFLIKIASSIYLFDPAEINFLFGNSGQSSQMFQAPAEARIKGSKDRGLRPMLRHIATNLNRYLIWRIDDRFKLEFTGLNQRDSDQIIDSQKKLVSFMMTVDEVRAEDDLPPLPDGKGEVILDPTWLQFSQAKDMAEQQDEEGGFGFGDEGDEGQEGGDQQEDPEGKEDADEGDEGEGKGFEEMLANLKSVGAEKSARHNSTLRKAKVRQENKGDVVIYDLEF